MGTPKAKTRWTHSIHVFATMIQSPSKLCGQLNTRTMLTHSHQRCACRDSPARGDVLIPIA
jgi:hypothetical protein